MDVPTVPHKTLQPTPSLLAQSLQIPGKRVHVCQNRFAALIFYVKHRIMTKFCGYLVGNDWLFQRGIESPPRRDETKLTSCWRHRGMQGCGRGFMAARNFVEL
jgi:hypothetical protein